MAWVWSTALGQLPSFLIKVSFCRCPQVLAQSCQVTQRLPRVSGAFHRGHLWV